MKTKITILAVTAVAATIIALHTGHEAPKDGKCPLASAIASKK